MSPRSSWLPLLGALAALGLAIAYASVTIKLAGKVALPIDDAYRHLTCATRGACPESTSVSWPALLALPGRFAQGPGLVAIAFWLAAALHALAVAGCFAIARRLGGVLAGALAAVAMLAIAPLAYTSLAGTATALVIATWIGALVLFGRREGEAPGLGLALVLSVLGLAQREALVVVALIALAGAWRTHSWRALVAWLVPVLPALAWRLVAAAPAKRVELEALRGDGLPLAIAFAGLWLVGVVRAPRNRLALLAGLTPICFVVVGGTGAAFPACAIVVGLAAAEGARWARLRLAGGVLACLALAGLAVLPQRAGLVQFAQDASDLERRVAPFAGRFADATAIGAHDPAAVAYASGKPTIALDGPDPLEGPGAKLERLERLAPELRPSHLITNPVALGTDAVLGEVRQVGRAGPKLAAHAWSRGEVQWIEAAWDHLNTAERPLTAHPGWRVVDRLDVADLDGEAAHGWRAQVLGAQATLLHREPGSTNLLLDGGRTLRGETFRIDADPARPARLILRTGGARQYPGHEPLARGASLRIAGQVVSVPAPRGALVEIELALPAGTHEVTVEADGPYRAFHWFVLQPR